VELAGAFEVAAASARSSATKSPSGSAARLAPSIREVERGTPAFALLDTLATG
jgi:hypothetical protein